MPDTDVDVLASVQAVLRQEGEAVVALAGLMAGQAPEVIRAVALISDQCGDGSPGRLVATGVGKAGIIARKVLATFVSTGTPGLFLHPAEARHGDLGMVQAADVVLAFSNSGASEEIVAILPNLKLIGCAVIALVGTADSPLGRHADVVLSIGKVVEACPLGLAPSTSTTALLALGDALALTVQRRRRFTPEAYARYHPGGALGRRLMACREVMRTGERVAAVPATATIADCIQAITRARSGSAVLVDAAGGLVGIFTDGDLRRALTKGRDPGAVLAAAVATHATVPCRSVRADELLTVALRLCGEKKIHELPVIEDSGLVVGLLDLKDLSERGFVS